MTESIFKKDDEGNLVFVGNFNAYYSEFEDPWGQSNKRITDMSEYYLYSRRHLVEKIKCLITDNKIKISEVGCGLGYILKEMHAYFEFAKLSGYDISDIAIQKARSLNGHFADFYTHDIRENSLPKHANIVILSNILWYILDDIVDVMDNSIRSLEPSDDGKMHLLIHNAFFKEGEQKYGLDIVSSLNDIVGHLSNSIKNARQIKLVAINACVLDIINSKYDEAYIMASFAISES